jgi:hypothetical protein
MKSGSSATGASVEPDRLRVYGSPTKLQVKVSTEWLNPAEGLHCGVQRAARAPDGSVGRFEAFSVSSTALAVISEGPWALPRGTTHAGCR